METREAWFGRARTAVTILSSVVALGFSGYSFYETVMKQPELRFYPPPKIYMFEEGSVEGFAVPVTISNDGARRGTVLSFDLEVTNRVTGKTMKFKNLGFGEKSKDAHLFTPMTIAGRSSTTEVVLFYAKANGSLITEASRIQDGARLPLRLTLKMNMDTGGDWIAPRQPAPVVFDMTANSVPRKGTPDALYDALWADETLPPLDTDEDHELIALPAYKATIFPAQRAAIHKAAGFEVPIDVDWDAIAHPDRGESREIDYSYAYTYKAFWTDIYFVPLARALAEATRDGSGKQAVRDKLKKIVVTYNRATASEEHVKFEDGVLTVAFPPFTNAPYMEPRVKAIREKLDAVY